MASYKGINWGKIAIDGDSLILNNLGNGQKLLSLDCNKISNSIINKNDVIIQTTAEDVNNDDCICQIRFHVECPKDENQIQQQNGNAQEDAQKNLKQNNKAAHDLYKQIVENAKIGEMAGQSIATLNEVNLVVPRGKYTIDFYNKSLRLHGITFNYNIDYKNILKGFLLPMVNQSQTSIVLQLDKPIYQGQTVYPYIVIQVKKQIEVQVKTKLKPQYENTHLAQLKAEYKGPLFQAIVELIRTTAQCKIIVPGTEFKSKSGQVCIKCGVKAQSGWLYFLKNALIFIPKPVTYFKTEDIKKVQFNRLSSTNKQFDMKLTMKSEKKSIQYCGIQRPQLQVLIQYFKSRGVKIEMEEVNTKIIPDIDDDESEDADFQVNEVQQEGSQSSSQSDEDKQENGSVSGQKSGHKSKSIKQAKQQQ